MSDIFAPVEMEWGGKVYTVPARSVMGLISQIEDVLTLAELQNYALRGTAPMGKMSMAYGRALRYAGAQITDEEIYDATFSGPERQAAVSNALINVMRMMLPESARKKFERATEGTEPGNLPAAAAASSKKPSRSVAGRKTGAARG